MAKKKDKEIEIQEFGQNLLAIRKRLKLTHEDLALGSDLDEKQISRIENGLLDIRLSTILCLLDGLPESITANDLFPKRK